MRSTMSNRPNYLIFTVVSSVATACGGAPESPAEATSSVVGVPCAEAPAVGRQSAFECTQVIGFSQTAQWYGIRDGEHFERQPGIDGDRWQLLWHGGAGVDLWADPDYEGWDPSVPATSLVSPCVSRSDRPDRVVLTISSADIGADSPPEVWAAEIEAAIATIRDKYSPRRIVLQPVVGGTPEALCETRASNNHLAVVSAIELVTTNRIVRGPYPEVEDCSWFSDSTGHLARRAGSLVAEDIAVCYDW